MPILNYTTSIDPHKTVAEIQKLLATKGARGILLEYNQHGDPSAVMFQIEVKGLRSRIRIPSSTRAPSTGTPVRCPCTPTAAAHRSPAHPANTAGRGGWAHRGGPGKT